VKATPVIKMQGWCGYAHRRSAPESGQQKPENRQLVNTLIEGFSHSYLNTASIASVVCGLPDGIWQPWLFASMALPSTNREGAGLFAKS